MRMWEVRVGMLEEREEGLVMSDAVGTDGGAGLAACCMRWLSVACAIGAVLKAG